MLNFGSTKKTVASVLAAFTKTISDLEQVERENQAEAERQAQIAEEARAARVAAINEAASAREVANKLTALTTSAIPPQFTLMGENDEPVRAIGLQGGF